MADRDNMRETATSPLLGSTRTNERVRVLCLLFDFLLPFSDKPFKALYGNPHNLHTFTFAHNRFSTKYLVTVCLGIKYMFH